jgi:hypothetical protein
VHDNTNQVFIIAVGEAQFIAGGTIADAWVTAPGQTRGSGMVSHHLTKGRCDHDPGKTRHSGRRLRKPAQ